MFPEKLGRNINFSLTKGYDMGIKDLTQGRIVTGGLNFDLPTKRSYLPNEVRVYEGFITTQASGPLVPAGRVAGFELAKSFEASYGVGTKVNTFGTIQVVPEHQTYSIAPSPFTKALYGTSNSIFKAYEWIKK